MTNERKVTQNEVKLTLKVRLTFKMRLTLDLSTCAPNDISPAARTW